MMDDWITWLGVGIGTGGLIASVAGVLFAFLARRAAKSAEQAAREARRTLARSIGSVDVERAINLVRLLKDVHYRRNWDNALGLYQDLRRTLSEIGASVANDRPEYHKRIGEAIPQITEMENVVGRSRYESGYDEPENIPEIDSSLREIQEDLEALLGSMMYSDEGGSE